MIFTLDMIMTEIDETFNTVIIIVSSIIAVQTCRLGCNTSCTKK